MSYRSSSVSFSPLKLALATSFLLIFAQMGCTKPIQVKNWEDPLGSRSGEGDEDGRSAANRAGASASDVPQSALDELRANFEKVHFPYDSVDLTDETRKVLDRNAQILNRYPAIRVTLEGHCDDRGSTEYNLALGERRSASVEEYLVRLGVAETQLRKVSFGEERPLAQDSNEGAWAENRRVEFVATVGAGPG